MMPASPLMEGGDDAAQQQEIETTAAVVAATGATTVDAEAAVPAGSRTAAATAPESEDPGDLASLACICKSAKWRQQIFRNKLDVAIIPPAEQPIVKNRNDMMAYADDMLNVLNSQLPAGVFGWLLHT
eukprot:1724506-Lingulodinium_polyedra.AAC.1